MRITLAVTGPIPCKGYGGSQRQVEWLATELTRLGHQVVVIAGKITGPAAFEVRQATSHQQYRDAIPKDTQFVHFHGPYFDVPVPSLSSFRRGREQAWGRWQLELCQRQPCA